jgi:hypothetical protein
MPPTGTTVRAWVGGPSGPGTSVATWRFYCDPATGYYTFYINTSAYPCLQAGGGGADALFFQGSENGGTIVADCHQDSTTGQWVIHANGTLNGGSDIPGPCAGTLVLHS